MEQGDVFLLNMAILGHVDAGKTALARALSDQGSTASFDKHPQVREEGTHEGKRTGKRQKGEKKEEREKEERKNGTTGNRSPEPEGMGSVLFAAPVSWFLLQSQARGITLDLGFSAIHMDPVPERFQRPERPFRACQLTIVDWYPPLLSAVPRAISHEIFSSFLQPWPCFVHSDHHWRSPDCRLYATGN